MTINLQPIITFFATPLGESASDGIGETIKREAAMLGRK